MKCCTPKWSVQPIASLARSQYAAASCAVLSLLVSVSAHAAVHNVSNAAQLQTAFSNASAGDEIVMAPGNYGNVSVSNKTFNGFVTVRSSNPANPALITTVTLSGSSFIEFKDLLFARTANDGGSVVVISDSDDIRVIDSEIRGPIDSNYSGPRYGVSINSGSDSIRIQGCNIHNLLRGTFALSASNIEYVENTWDYLGEDGIDFSSVDGLLILNNEFGGHHFKQPGGHMDFIQGSGGNSNDINIRGNVMICRNTPAIQGIFLGDVVYGNVLIEQNVIYTGMGHGILVDFGSGVVIRHNTVLHADGTGSSATFISNPSGAVKTGNIYVNWQPATGNLVLPFADGLNPQYAAYFEDPVTTALNENYSILNFIPKAGTAADNPNMGAYLRIDELTGFSGGNRPPSVSEITQTPNDHDGSAPGSQIIEETVVTYSGSATDVDGDPLSWQWLYKINGGAETEHANGFGNVTPTQYAYGLGTAGQTFEWILRVNDGTVSRQKNRFTQIISSDGGTPTTGGGAVLGWDTIDVGLLKQPTIYLADPQPDSVDFYHNGVFNRTDTTGPDDGDIAPPDWLDFRFFPAVTLLPGDEIRAEWGNGLSHTVYAVSGTTPQIVLVGQSPATIQKGNTYVDEGATAFDVQDGNITSQIVVSNNVNTKTAGTYMVTYNVTDSNGNVAVPVSRTVHVVGAGGFNVPYYYEEGDTLQVTIPVAASPPMQWMKGSTPLVDDLRVSGATTNTLTISPLEIADTGAYSVQFDDGSKATISMGPFAIAVLPVGALPVSGPIPIGIAVVVMLATGAMVLRKFAVR